MKKSDITFITNEEGSTLGNRFKSLIKDTRLFDVLVGYFYTSGFYSIYPSLERTEKIRILIGISTNPQTYNLIKQIQSHKEVKEHFGEQVKSEMEQSENNLSVEEGVSKFIQWLKSGKLEIKAYPDEKIHSKLYIMTFDEEDRDLGRVITGSSNFSLSGLSENLEFNVELKDPSDYNFAQERFNKLWENSIDVSEEYLDTVKKKTWLRDDITPYELYLKFLYEYFKEEINEDTRLDYNYRPENFKEFQYQEHAVIDAKKIVEEYGGVFLSDVVGLGKTYMGTMLAQELSGKTLVLAPPHLIDENNQGSWENAFRDFGFRASNYKCRSIGILDKIIERNEHEAFENILIDESHRFRTEDNETYSKLAQICRGKKVILVTATPYNNSPKDLLSQIKLFQRVRQSTIPNLPDLEGFFTALNNKLRNLDRKENKKEYIQITKENSKLIRERVLKYIMVRRTRKEIEVYYKDDLKKQGVEFPKIANPEPLFYKFNDIESEVFYKTIDIVSNKFKYSRYTPLLYYKGDLGSDEQRQLNMMKFMKMLFVKRLESSFVAFNKSLDRFIHSYERFITSFEQGEVYVSRKHINKIFDYLDAGNLHAIDQLIEEGKAEKFLSQDFTENFIVDLKNDLSTLKEVKSLWEKIDRDPKLIAFKEDLLNIPHLINNKMIVFTESTETAEYLKSELDGKVGKGILLYTGSSSLTQREVVLDNFDANTKNSKNDYQILIATDVLAEGINLHQANVVVNYDIPWNPTKIMQRVGRINRVDTAHKNIYTYTFFPTDQSNDQIKLRESAESKIAAFISLLGVDSKLLTEEEEVEAHSLFNRLISKETIEGEEEVDSELKYLQEIRKLRDENPNLFEKIKSLPKKARTARIFDSSQLFTYFRKGKLQKFFIVKTGESEISKEIDFFDSVKLLKVSSDEHQVKLDGEFYNLLEKNNEMLEKMTENNEEYIQKRSGRNHAIRLARILKSKEVRQFPGFTEYDEEYLSKVISELEAGGIPMKLAKKINEKIESNPELIMNPLKILAILRTKLPEEFLKPIQADNNKPESFEAEIVLSEYFKKK